MRVRLFALRSFAWSYSTSIAGSSIPCRRSAAPFRLAEMS